MNRKEVQAAVNKICDSSTRVTLEETQDEVGVLLNLAERWLEEQESKEVEVEDSKAEIEALDTEARNWYEWHKELLQKYIKAREEIQRLSNSSQFRRVETQQFMLDEKDKQIAALLNVYRQINFDHIRGELEDECPVCYNGKSHCTCVLGDLRKAKEEREENEK
jgi:DNA repair ATPase RecN